MRENPLNVNPNMRTNLNYIDGIYRGIVEDNDDPLNLCRLRVRVPYLNGMPNTRDGIPTDGLPWAAACIPYAGPSYGEVLIPEVGSTVWLLFENHAKDRPVWIGCSYGAVSHSGYRDLKAVGKNTFKNTNGHWRYDFNREDTPYTFVDRNKDAKILVRTPKGFEIIIDEKDEAETLDIVDRLGQIIRMHCPTTVQSNANNASRRTFGDVVIGDINEGVMENMIKNQNYILIESQAFDHEPSYVKLMENNVSITNGTSYISQFGQTTVFDNGRVKAIFNGEEGTFQVTNLPDSAFQMNSDSNSIINGTSEIVVKDNEVMIDNGKVGIKLSDAIELSGPVRWSNGKQVVQCDKKSLKVYRENIKLATGKSSIILNEGNVSINGNTRIVSGSASINVGGGISLSGGVGHNPDPSAGEVRIGDVSISDAYYQGWYHGQREANYLPCQ